MYAHVTDTRRNHASDGKRSKRQKSVLLAVVLNCLLPGAGLAYLGRWPWAIANFLIAQLIVFGCFLVNEPTIIEHIHWVVMAVMAGSGGFAHAVAKSSTQSGASSP